MLIRTEAPADILVIDQLLKSTFESEDEANLVMSLRENSHLTLSLVACSDEGEVIGHVLFSPVDIAGQPSRWQGLAPLCVKKQYQGQGVATKLIEQGFEMLKDFSYPVCVVLGDPNFYQRLGFLDASTQQLTCPWDVPKGAFQVIELVEGHMTQHQGLVTYSPEFDAL